MKKHLKTPDVFFNASVILAGLRSSKGGSAKILGWSRKGEIKGVVSEVVLDEVLRRYKKAGIKRSALRNLNDIFSEIRTAPNISLVEKIEKIVLDLGDAHVLASGMESKVSYLVSLDKKHILSLRGKILRPKIVSPGQLIEKLSNLN